MYIIDEGEIRVGYKTLTVVKTFELLELYLLCLKIVRQWHFFVHAMESIPTETKTRRDEKRE